MSYLTDPKSLERQVWVNSVDRDHLTLVTRKPVFGFSDQVRLKPACSAIEAS